MKKEFNIKVEMEERWINDFCSMLKEMENFGNLGKSKIIGIYSDGDGDFRPKFNIDTEFKTVKPIEEDSKYIAYDAG